MPLRNQHQGLAEAQDWHIGTLWGELRALTPEPQFPSMLRFREWCKHTR